MGDVNEVQRKRRCRFDAMALAFLIGTISVGALLAFVVYGLVRAIVAIVCTFLTMLMAVQW